MLEEHERNQNLNGQANLINNNNNNNVMNLNPNESYINTISLSNLRNFFFSLGVTDNTLTDLERFANNATRINQNSSSRLVTRYQKYPLCYSKISSLLTQLQNPNLSVEQHSYLDSKLFETLEKFSFTNSEIPFYKNISSGESKIKLPYIIFKSGIKGIAYAIAIGHLGLIN